MKIIALDGYTMNPGDLNWDKFRKLGHLTVHERTPANETLARAQDAEILITNKTILDRSVLEQLPKLRYIGITATGTNVVDLQAAKERGVTVTNVPGYSTPSVVQHTFALILELTNQTALHDRSVREGEWTRCPDFCYWKTPLTELDALTLGIVGFGDIGKAVAKAGQAFGMKTLVHTRTIPEKKPKKITFCDRETLFKQSDVISLHCPLTEQTKHIINAQTLGQMKPSAYLINTGRGALVDEPALALALNKDVIAGAGLDVLSQEPPPADNPLLHAKNCVITPHLAWATHASRQRLMDVVFKNLRSFLRGKPQNVIV